MNRFFKGTIVRFIGILTALLVVIAVVFMHSDTQYDIRLIPFGRLMQNDFFAFIVGILVSSGYYYSCSKLNYRPSAWMLLEMLLVGSAALFFIHYLIYQLFLYQYVASNQNMMLFSKYMDLAIEHAWRHHGRWMLYSQIVMMNLGPIATCLVLMKKSFCKHCNIYRKRIAKKIKTFENREEFDQYYNALQGSKDITEISHLMSEQHLATLKKGNLRLDETLFKCPQCKNMQLNLIMREYDGKDWVIEKLPNSTIERSVVKIDHDNTAH